MSDFYDNRKEEWTRRKSYLLRSLFEDEPMLSTILEEDESITQHSVTTQSKHFKDPLPSILDRLHTPLPELTIEFVPRRPKTYDDEPQEFYKQLEKQMRKLYRRDYLNSFSSSKDDSSTQNDHELNVYEDNFQNIDSDVNLDSEQSIGDEDVHNKQDKSSEISKSSVDRSTQSNSNNNGSTNKLETTVEMELSDENNNASTSSKEFSSSENSKEVTESSNDERSQDKERNTTMELEGNNGLGADSGSDSPIPEPDIMRRQYPRLSLFSPTNHDCDESLEKLELLHPRTRLTYMEEVLDNHDLDLETRNITGNDDCGRNTETLSEIIAFNVTSTPKSISYRTSSKKSPVHRFEPYSASSSSKSVIAKINRALQTSFSEEESDSQSLWRNLLIGSPTFYKLQKIMI